MKSSNPFAYLDSLSVFCYIALISIGVASIYSASFDPDNIQPFYSLKIYSGKQLIWIAGAGLLIMIIFLLDYRVFESIAWIAHIGVLGMLMLVLIIGKEVNGAKAWFGFGDVGIQPAEFAKITTSLILASYLSRPGVKITDFKSQLSIMFLLGIPIFLILLQPDLGSAMVFACLVLALYREGLHPLFLVIPVVLATLFILGLIIQPLWLAFILLNLGALSIGIVWLVKRKLKRDDFLKVILPTFLLITFIMVVPKVFKSLKKYHQDRIMVLLDENIDKQKRSVRYNLEQSKIAIGSGGFWGKGYLKGTQTKFDFVPEQHTDFVFCTVGEEFGWMGSMVMIVLFLTLLSRIIIISERSKNTFARIYGYCVGAILFAHFTMNLAMTVGLFPTIGIPLPFISYGGSSMWAFSILLFILLKLDMHRNQLLSR